MRQTLTGEVRNIATRPLGSALAADAPVGAAELLVEDVADFSEDGGTLRLGGVLYDYLTVDDDTDTVFLTGPLTAAGEAEAGVESYDALAREAAVEVIAQVALDGAPDGSDLILASLTHGLVPFLPEGDREDGRGETVTIEQQNGEWVVTNVLGRTASFNGSTVYVDSSHVMTPIGGAAISQMPLPGGLTITAGTESIKVVWSGTAAEQIPIDFGRLAIHVSKFSGYTPTQGTEVATVSSPYGGAALYAADGGDTYYVRCAIASLRGDYGDFTEEVAVTPGVAADPNTFEGDIVGGSISIATVQSSTDSETFAGTAFPAGWTVVNGSSPLGVPGFSVVSSGVPAGSDNGSAMLLDHGPADPGDDESLTFASGYVLTDAPAAVDVEVTTRFRFNVTPGFDGGFGAFERTRVFLRQRGTSPADGVFVSLARQPKVMSRVSGSDTDLGNVGGLLSGGIWYNLRARAVGGRIEVSIWEDGSTEPAPTLFLESANVSPGRCGVEYDDSPYIASPALGLDVWFDTINVETFSTGFSVLPDGTARMTRAEIDELITPYPMAAGRENVSAIAGTVTQAVSFPTGRFPAGSVVAVTTDFADGSPVDNFVSAYGVTDTGFTLAVTADAAKSMWVSWIARVVD